MKMFNKKKKQTIQEKPKVNDEIWQTTDDEQYMIDEAIKGNVDLIRSHYHPDSLEDELKQKITQKNKKQNKSEHIEEITVTPLNEEVNPYIGIPSDDDDSEEIKRKEQELKEMGKALDLGKEENKNIVPAEIEMPETPKEKIKEDDLPVYEKIEEYEIPEKKEKQEKPKKESKTKKTTEEPIDPIEDKVKEKPKFDFKKHRKDILIFLVALAFIIVVVTSVILVNQNQEVRYREVSITYEVVDVNLTGLKNETNITIAKVICVIIKNTDTEGGIFNVTFKFTIDGKQFTRKNSVYIESDNQTKICGTVDVVSPKTSSVQYIISQPYKKVEIK